MHFRLIDGNSLGFQQFHGQPERVSPQGKPCHAVFGVLNSVRNLLNKTPDVLNILLWDGRAQWRYDLLPGYKGGRHQTPTQREERAAYELQRPLLQKALSYLPVVQLTHPGAEADDLAWGLTQRFDDQGHFVTLLTLDSDWLQMVSARTRWENLRSPYQKVELADFSKTSGGYYSPELVPQVKALAGDSADSIPGLQGIAVQRALALLGKYQSVANLLSAAEDFTEFSREPAYAHAIMLPDSADLVRRNLKLISLKEGPALKGADAVLGMGEGEELDLYETFVDLGFNDCLSYFASWKKVTDIQIPGRASVALQRALSTLERAWTHQNE